MMPAVCLVTMRGPTHRLRKETSFESLNLTSRHPAQGGRSGRFGGRGEGGLQ